MMHMADAQMATPPHLIVAELPHLPSPSRAAYTFGASFGIFSSSAKKQKAEAKNTKSGGETRSEPLKAITI
jgi:ABC-type glycerol-3-phosphate transport system substrate-binding protein